MKDTKEKYDKECIYKTYLFGLIEYERVGAIERLRAFWFDVYWRLGSSVYIFGFMVKK